MSSDKPCILTAVIMSYFLYPVTAIAAIAAVAAIAFGGVPEGD